MQTESRYTIESRYAASPNEVKQMDTDPAVQATVDSYLNDLK